MHLKTIKISEPNYKTISHYAGRLQAKLGKPVSLDKALTLLFRKSKFSDLAGSWKMSDGEAEEFLKNIKKGWKNWKIGSV